MRRLRLAASFLALAAALILSSGQSGIGLRPSNNAEAACPQYVTEADLINDVCGRNLFITNPGVGNTVQRPEFVNTALFGYYQSWGFNRNFLWYAPEVTMHIPRQNQNDPGVIPWAGCANAPFNPLSGHLSLCGGPPEHPGGPVGFPHINSTAPNSVFNNPNGVNIRALQWPPGPATNGTTFIGVGCGNFSRPTNGTPVPKISGTKYEDLNANGTRDGGEPGLSGWTMELRNSGGVVVQTRVTNATGYYQFDLLDIGPDTYTITEVGQPGWTQRQAPGPVVVGIGIGDPNFGNNDFGNWRHATASGIKYDDLNGNGQQDGGEPGLGGWTITLTGADGYGAPVNRSEVTAPNGTFSFTNVVPGQYTVDEILQVGPDWVQTEPPSGDYDVPLVSNQTLNDLAFGNLVRGQIDGMKFEDFNENGTRDGGDNGLGGWTIRLDGTDGMGNAVARTAVTAADGSYAFDEIMPGTYTVCEVNPDAAVWDQTMPPPPPDGKCHPFTIQSHADEDLVDFGNYERSMIRGVKYSDEHKDGAQNNGDPPLGSWEITLLDCDGNVVPQSMSSVTQPGETSDPNPQFTNASGEYQFGGLHNDCYRVDETIQSPTWVQTQPCLHPIAPCGYEIDELLSGSVVVRDFGNFEQTPIEKIPEGNENNVDLAIPAANLWLCEDTDGDGPICDGAGEGALRVVEHATNIHTGDQNGDSIEDGLGAYEFTVEYDNFVISSVNPCDIVFGPGGAGSARGPVDELDTSAINPDCTPDPGAGGGTCSYSHILENVIHFGCATAGQTPGPTGDMDLASLLLIPHEDLANDLFPGNENGVVTIIKDNGCELVDTFGHPIIGSVNGGLTPFCGDLAVTVRILEGDLDLNCEVDVTDAQLIAGRFGGFFGGLMYSKWYDLEPALHDLDIDIKDLQKVFGRDGSTCQNPVPPQPPLPYP